MQVLHLDESDEEFQRYNTMMVPATISRLLE